MRRSLLPMACWAALLLALCAGCDDAAPTPRVMAAGGSSPTTSAPAPQTGTGAATSAADAPIREASFDDLKFPMEKTDEFREAMLTDKVKGLFDRRIRIRGYMFPTLRKKGLTQFVLVRDNLECCFGPGAALFDCVLVTMAPGATATYSIYPLAVEGRFRFEPLPGPDDRPVALFRMAGERVE